MIEKLSYECESQKKKQKKKDLIWLQRVPSKPTVPDPLS